jgi:flagellar L-ring protein FlgH
LESDEIVLDGNQENRVKTVWCCVLVLQASWLHAGSSKPTKASAKGDTLANYLARVQPSQPAAALSLTPGSIWIDNGRMAALSADYKAMAVGDLITVAVVQSMNTSNDGAVSTTRTLNTSSGITSLPGKLKTGGVANLLALNSSEALAGKSQATSDNSVTTTLAGRVVAVLASGNLVVEAQSLVDMNHEKRTVILRGIVRPGDIGPNDTVASNNLSDLELEIKGKGVVSDGVRPPHKILRAILNILDF